MLKLNLGCWEYKVPGFVNIDMNPSVNPDMVMDLRQIATKFEPDSVDYINAGHVLEHMTYQESLDLLNNCYDILKPCSVIIVIVPNYEIATRLCSPQQAEGIILANGEHKQIFNDEKLKNLFCESKFRYFYNIGIENIPYMVVSNIRDPKPDPWQSTMLGIKL